MQSVKIEISDKNRTVIYEQKCETLEDFEYVCIKAGLAWGFNDVFEDYDIMRALKRDLN